MTGHCKDCKFWGEERASFHGTPWEGLRVCDATMPIWEPGALEKLALVEHDHAALLCRADFGCVQFESK